MPRDTAWFLNLIVALLQRDPQGREEAAGWVEDGVRGVGEPEARCLALIVAHAASVERSAVTREAQLSALVELLTRFDLGERELHPLTELDRQAMSPDALESMEALEVGEWAAPQTP